MRVAVLFLVPLLAMPRVATSQWPSGKDGSLIIPAGATSQLPGGRVYDFSDVVIGSGATLEILPGDHWTIIGVKDSMKLAGRIIARGYEREGDFALRDTAPDNSILVWSVSVAQGGAGGSASCAGGGGAPGAGCGGGGSATGANGGNGSALTGGVGATTANPCIHALGGQGGHGFAAAGSPGNDVNVPKHNCGGAGGGGGGTRGRHGQPLYISVSGRLIGAGGQIDLSGENGGQGGNGGNATVQPFASGLAGGGGGGGGGGAGGTLVLHYGPSSSLPVMNVSGGNGGAGGRGGTLNGNRTCDGSPGSAGKRGDIIIK